MPNDPDTIISHPYLFLLAYSLLMFSAGIACGFGLRSEYCRRLKSKLELYRILTGGKSK